MKYAAQIPEKTVEQIEASVECPAIQARYKQMGEKWCDWPNPKKYTKTESAKIRAQLEESLRKFVRGEK